MDLTSLSIGLVGVAITLAGIVLLRPADEAAMRPQSGADAAPEGRARISP